jgi:hypothetical protein
MGITKTVVRAGVITALVGGAAVVIATPERVSAVFSQTRNSVHRAIDSKITDPVALRAQLRALESQYPYRIQEVEGDLRELELQMTQLRREAESSRLAARMAEDDLAQMQAIISKGQEAREQGLAQVVKVRFANERPVDLDQAMTKATRVTQVRDAFLAKAIDVERDLGYLDQQHDRLSDLLAQLKQERAEFQTQLFSLDRQVDAIARNERMIEVMEKRQDTIENHSRYRAASLDQVTGRLAEIRARQESKLQMYGQSSEIKNYENAAKYLLDSQQSAPRPLRTTTPKAVEIGPSTIEIGPEHLNHNGEQPERKGTVASR